MSEPHTPGRADDDVVCRAQMNYVGRDPDTICPTEVVICNARRASLPGWQEIGFELMPHRSSITDWQDDTAIEQQHYAEMAALARALTGCDHAMVAGHIKRNPQQAAVHADLGPITFVHSDFAASYGDLLRATYRQPRPETQRALQRAGIDGDTVCQARRLMVLQFWRNLGPPKMDLPLAFCDARTVRADDLQTLPVTNYAGGGFDFDTLGVRPPADAGLHRWYVFPLMQAHEVVAFRTFDSERVGSGEAYWTPHSAFHDPEVELGHPSRSSIELRATCLFL